MDPTTCAPHTIVRLATTADRDAIQTMALRFIAETAYKDRLVGEPVALYGLIDRFLQGDAGAGFVADYVTDAGAVVVGMVGVLVFPNPVTGEPTGSELIWWVEPAARHTRAAMKLVRAAEAWARSRGATAMQLVSWQGRLDTFYERLGFAPMETVYQRPLTEEHTPCR